MQVAVGSYTGTAGAQTITVPDLLIAPAFVLIKAHSTQRPVAWSTTMGANVTKPITGAAATASGLVTAVAAGTFSVGTDPRTNDNGVTFDYLVLADNGAADIHLGSYTGNGTSQSVAVGWQPDFVFTLPASAINPAWKTSDMSGDDYFSQFSASLDTASQGITLTTTGFDVGSGVGVNTTSVVQHYIALKVATVFEVGTFTGNGSDNHNVTPFSIAPDFVWSKGTGAGSGASAAAVRFKDNAGDSSSLLGPNGYAADRIQSFSATGFQLGVSDGVNVSTEDYYTIAFTVGLSGTPIEVDPRGRIFELGAPGDVVAEDVIPQGADPATGALLDWRRGYSTSGTIPVPTAGSASFLLDNGGGDYDETDLLPGDAFQARREDPFDSTVYDLFYGRCEVPVDDLRGEPNPLQRTVAIQLTGTLARLAGRKASTELYSDITTDQALGYLLDAIGFPTELREFDTGLTTFFWWWADEADVMTAMLQILGSEGITADLYERADGVLVFRNRAARFTDTRSTAVQTTFRNSGAQPLIAGFQRARSAARIINAASMTINSRAPTGNTTEVVFTTEGDNYIIGPGQTLVLEARSTTGEPFQGAIVPVAATDFTEGTGTVDTVTLSRTSGMSTTITFESAGGVVISNVQLRAELVPRAASFVMRSQVDASASIAQYGQIDWGGGYWPEMLWSDAQALVDAIVTYYKDGRAIIEIVVQGERSPEALTACLALEIGDRVRVIEGIHGIDAEGWIESMAHSIRAPLNQRTVFAIEVASADPFA